MVHRKVTSAPDLVARQNEQEVDLWTKAFIGGKKTTGMFPAEENEIL